MHGPTYRHGRRLATVALALPIAAGASLAMPAGAGEPPGASSTEATIPTEPPAAASIVADVDAIAAGVPFLLGVRLEMNAGWHVYWKNPGDAGLSTRVEITSPAGFDVGEIHFPVPIRFEQPGEIVGYGYEDAVVLVALVTPPADLPIGENVTFGVRTDWLACARVCIPGGASFSRTFPTTDWTQPSWETRRAWSASWPATGRKLPFRTSTDVETATGGTRTVSVTLDWKGSAPEVIEWMPAPGDRLLVTDPRVASRGARTEITFDLELIAGSGAAPASLESLIVYHAGGARRGAALDVPLGP